MMATRGLLSRSIIMVLVCAAAGCGGPPPPSAPVDADLERSNSAARSAFDRGELPEATVLYEQALTRARVLDDPAAIADAAYNLAACLSRQGDLARARQLLHEAEWELAQLGQNADDVVLLDARIARQLGSASQALALADRLISNPHDKAEAGPIVGAHLLRGRIALDRHDVITASKELAAATSANSTNKGHDDATLAGIFGLSAEIAVEQKSMRSAASLFDSQSAYLQAAEDYPGMASALGRAGNAYLAAGAPDLAADRLYRAARCFFGLSQTGKARKFLDAASEAAGAARSSSLADLAQALKEEMNVAATRPSAATLPSLPTEAPAP